MPPAEGQQRQSRTPFRRAPTIRRPPRGNAGYVRRRISGARRRQRNRRRPKKSTTSVREMSRTFLPFLLERPCDDGVKPETMEKGTDQAVQTVKQCHFQTRSDGETIRGDSPHDGVGDCFGRLDLRPPSDTRSCKRTPANFLLQL